MTAYLTVLLENKGEKSAYNLTEVSKPSSFLSIHATALMAISLPSCKVK
jgi:hypothetical protein